MKVAYPLLIATKVHNSYDNHLLKMASINVGSEDSILLQQSGHNVCFQRDVDSTTCQWLQVVLVGSREQEKVLMTNEWSLKCGLVMCDNGLQTFRCISQSV